MIESSHNTVLSYIITAFGNFSIQYNFQCISIVLLLISQSECTLNDDTSCKQGKQAGWVHGTSTAIIFVGTILGQLVMGYVGDRIGRSKALIFTTSLACLSALCSAVIPSGSPSEVYALIIVFRLFLGIGLGGVFPLSATKSSEDSGDQVTDIVNPVAAAWTYFWQIPGIIVPYLVALLVFTNASLSLSSQWRIILGVGAIPSFISVVGLLVELYYDYKDRMVDLSQSSYELTQSRLDSDSVHSNHFNESVQESPVNQKDDSSQIMCKIIATGGTWFLFDVVCYGVLLSGGEIIHSFSNTDDNVSSHHNIRETSVKQLIAASLGIPSTILAIKLLPVIGIKNLQLFAFTLISVMTLVLSCALQVLKGSDGSTEFIIYCLLYFSIQCGCNVTLFALPSALFPRNVRSTYNGIASALGKLGAVIGSYSFFYIANESSYSAVMSISCVISIIGAIVTFFFLETAKINASVTYGSSSQQQGVRQLLPVDNVLIINSEPQ